MQFVVGVTSTFTTVEESLSRIPVGVSIGHISHACLIYTGLPNCYG